MFCLIVVMSLLFLGRSLDQANMKKGVLSVTYLFFSLTFFIIFNTLLQTKARATCSLSWSTTSIDTSGAVGYYTSLAVDSSGELHISYYDGTDDNLKYATNTSGSWAFTNIDTSGNVGFYTSIAVDSSSYQHISYYYGPGDLKYATNSSGSWAFTNIDTFGNVGSYSSIAVDSSGKLHISYYDTTNADLKYATNSAGSWAFTHIDTASTVGFYTSIAVDSSGYRHIGYYDLTNANLKYATNSSGSWAFTHIDTASTVGLYTSLAVDSSGYRHISYFDSTNSNLKYATNSSGSWAFTHIDTSGYVGRETSIAVDSSGYQHISYYDMSFDNLKYATNSSGSWVFTNIDTASTAGLYTSLAVDSSGQFHISYFDDTDDDLKYAANTYPTYTLTVSISGSGTVTSSASEIDCGSDCTETYICANTLTLTATPSTNYEFTGWSNGGCSGAGTCTTSTLTSDTTITATFTLSTYTLTVTNSGGGTVTSSDGGINCESDCSETYSYGESITLTASADSGYAFTGWSGGTCSGSSSTCTFTFTAATSVTATFTVSSSGSATNVPFTDNRSMLFFIAVSGAGLLLFLKRYKESLLILIIVYACQVPSNAEAGSLGVYGGGSNTGNRLKTYYMAKEAFTPDVKMTVSDADGISPLIMTSPTVNNPQSLKFCFADSKGGFENATSGYTYYLAVWKDTTGTSTAEYIADNTIEAGELLPVIDSGSSTVPVGITSTVGGCLFFYTSSDDRLGYDIAGNPANLSTLTTTDKVTIMHITGDTSGSRYKPSTLFTTDNIGFNWYVASGGSTADTLSIEVTENSTHTYSAIFAEYFKQYAAGVTSKADGIINVYAERKKFTQNITNDSVVVSMADRNAVVTTGDPFYDDLDYTSRFLMTQTAGGGSVYDLLIDLEGTNQAVSSVVSGGTILAYDSENSRWRIRSDVSTGSTISTPFTIYVDTSNIIEERKFTTTISSVAEAGFTSYDYLIKESAGNWAINGYRGIIPYLLTLDSYASTCTVTNSTNDSVDVFLSILASEGGATSGLSNINLGEIESNKTAGIEFHGTTATLHSSNRVETIDLPELGANTIRYTGTIIITGNKNEIYATCVQKDPGLPGNRYLPVLTNRAAEGVKWGD